MDKEILIKKWLDHDLSPEEQIRFQEFEDAKDLELLSSALKAFQAPHYEVSSELTYLNSRLKVKSQVHLLRPFLKIAAVLAIGFSIFYTLYNKDTHVITEYATTTMTALPDASTVNLNAGSSLSFNERSWFDSREVHLNGEAFFKVAKGSKFEVITDAGTVRVLGTEFNVKHRKDNFEVTCYEGLVSVTYNGSTLKLTPGMRYAVIDGNSIANEKETQLLPSWMARESDFESRPLKFVLEELERQYGVTTKTQSVNLDTLYSGTFTHDDLELALKSITLPLQLDYTITNTEIIITRE